jgi:hypothetical protein
VSIEVMSSIWFKSDDADNEKNKPKQWEILYLIAKYLKSFNNFNETISKFEQELVR